MKNCLAQIPLRIALDIDGTITADPDFFADLSGSWIAAGRAVHIVSSRSPEARSETIIELKDYGIFFSAVYLLPPLSAAQKLCPHQNLDWFQRHLWLKVNYALTHRITHVVDDDPKVLTLFTRFAPDVAALSFLDRHQIANVEPDDYEMRH
ncbi:MAG: hypothetical protein NTV11_09785 [Rhodocyclales bacterium]|nr:hypothetical protein [Rhodocyclales bacterium]